MLPYPNILKIVILTLLSVDLLFADTMAESSDTVHAVGIDSTQSDSVAGQPSTTTDSANQRQAAVVDFAIKPLPRCTTLQLNGFNIELFQESAFLDSSRLGVVRDYDKSYLESINPMESGASELRRGFIFLGAGIQTAIFGAGLIATFEPRTPAGIVIPLLPASGFLVMSIACLRSGKLKMERHLKWEKHHAN